jgi:hypothetical protein
LAQEEKRRKGEEKERVWRRERRGREGRGERRRG